MAPLISRSALAYTAERPELVSAAASVQLPMPPVASACGLLWALHCGFSSSPASRPSIDFGVARFRGELGPRLDCGRDWSRLGLGTRFAVPHEEPKDAGDQEKEQGDDAVLSFVLLQWR